jgi:hypothetical protein
LNDPWKPLFPDRPRDARAADGEDFAALQKCNGVARESHRLSMRKLIDDQYDLRNVKINRAVRLEESAVQVQMLRCKLSGVKIMVRPLSERIDRVAMTFGLTALLAALPVAAIAVIVHAF